MFSHLFIVAHVMNDCGFDFQLETFKLMLALIFILYTHWRLDVFSLYVKSDTVGSSKMVSRQSEII